MINILYVGLGNDMHTGGVAEWAYRVGYYIDKSMFKFKVITNTDIPVYHTGTYEIIKVNNDMPSLKAISKYYVIDLIKFFSSNIYELSKQLREPTFLIFLDPITALIVSELTDTKIAVYTHIHELLYDKPTSFINTREVISVLKKAMTYLYVLTQSEYNRQLLLRHNIKAHVWTIPIAPEYIEYKTRAEDYIVYSGGFDEFKAPHIVLKLFEKLGDYRFVVVGGRRLRKIKRIVPRNVEVLGNVDRNQYYDILSRAFLSFHVSYVEAFSINVMDNGWFHPTILWNRDWTEYWEPMIKVNSINELCDIIRKLYRDENMYNYVLEKQREFIWKYHNPELFNSQFISFLDYYMSQTRFNDKTIDRIEKCASSHDIIKCMGWTDVFKAYKYLLWVGYMGRRKITNKQDSWW